MRLVLSMLAHAASSSTLAARCCEARPVFEN
jgi:hypothetical protein